MHAIFIDIILTYMGGNDSHMLLMVFTKPKRFSILFKVLCIPNNIIFPNILIQEPMKILISFSCRKVRTFYVGPLILFLYAIICVGSLIYIQGEIDGK